MIVFSPDGIANRTILPDIDMEIAEYVVTGSGPEGAEFTTATVDSAVIVDGLAFGDWTVTVAAENTAGIIIGRGTGAAVVHTGENSPVTVMVTPLSGYGTLDLTVTWNAGDTENPAIDAVLIPTLGSARTLAFALEPGRGTARLENVPAGYHTLIVKLLDNGLLTMGAVEIVRIVEGGVSSGGFAFPIINRPGGTITVTVIPAMQDPLTVTMTDVLAELPRGRSMSVTAAIAEPVGNTVYVWYLSGAAVGTGPTLTVGNTLGIGVYRLDVTAFTADGTRAGSAGVLFHVVEDTAGHTVYSLPDLAARSFDVTDNGSLLVAGARDGSIVAVLFNPDGSVKKPAFTVGAYDASVYTSFSGLDLASAGTDGRSAITWNFGTSTPADDRQNWVAFLDADGNPLGGPRLLDAEAGPGLNRPAVVRMSDDGVAAFFYEAQSLGAYRLVICNPDGSLRRVLDVGRGFLTNGALGRALGMRRNTGEIIVAGESWAASYPARRYYQRFTPEGDPIDPDLVVVPELDLVSGSWSNYLLIDYNDAGYVTFASDVDFGGNNLHKAAFFAPGMHLLTATPAYGDVYFTNDRILAPANGDFIVPINDLPTSVWQRYSQAGQLITTSDEGGMMRIDGADNVYYYDGDVIRKNPFPLQ